MRGFCNESCDYECVNTCVANLSVTGKAYAAHMNNLSVSAVKYMYLCDKFVTLGATCKVKPYSPILSGL